MFDASALFSIKSAFDIHVYLCDLSVTYMLGDLGILNVRDKDADGRLRSSYLPVATKRSKPRRDEYL